MAKQHAQHSAPSSSDGAGALILNPGSPLISARKFLEERYSEGDLWTRRKLILETGEIRVKRYHAVLMRDSRDGCKIPFA